MFQQLSHADTGSTQVISGEVGHNLLWGSSRTLLKPLYAFLTALLLPWA